MKKILLCLCLLTVSCKFVPSPEYRSVYYPEITNASNKSIYVCKVSEKDKKSNEIMLYCREVKPEGSISVHTGDKEYISAHINEIIILADAECIDAAKEEPTSLPPLEGKRLQLSQNDLDSWVNSCKPKHRLTSKQLIVLTSKNRSSTDPSCLTIDDNGDLQLLRPQDLPWYESTIDSPYKSTNACANPKTLPYIRRSPR